MTLTARPAKHIPLMRPAVGEEELRELKKVLDSGWLAQGPKVKEFEEKVASYLGARYVIATSSCTTALVVALAALRLKSGSAVVVPDFTFPATANAVISAEHEPLIADVGVNDFALDLKKVERDRPKRRKVAALMPVHPFGHPLDFEAYLEYTESSGAEVVEDAATAFGAKCRGRLVGSRGKAVCFSFHPRKLLTTGEGGCIATEDREICERAMTLRNHGQLGSGVDAKFVVSALNYRMSDLQAAVGVAQLGKIDGIIRRRRAQATIYTELLAEKRLPIVLPQEDSWAFSTFQSYVLVFGRGAAVDRTTCIGLLRSKYSIETQLGTYSVSSEPAFSRVRKIGRVRNGPFLYHNSLTLPLFDSITEEEQRYVVDSLSRVIKPS